MEEYENILEIIRNMVQVMERSPKAFENMGEEDLRTHFLVQLMPFRRFQANDTLLAFLESL